MSTRTRILGLATAAALVASGSGAGPAANITLDSYRNVAQLQVSSPAFANAGAIPRPYSAYGENFSPALAWTGAPANAKSIVLLMEDPDAQQPSPFVHWVVYDMPVTQSPLHESVPAIPRLKYLSNAQQGRNSRGTIGYFGPRPPAGDPAHHYHVQVFALDGPLGLPPGAAPAQVTAAMKGHVVAAGEIVGTFAP